MFKRKIVLAGNTRRSSLLLASRAESSKNCNITTKKTLLIQSYHNISDATISAVEQPKEKEKEKKNTIQTKYLNILAACQYNVAQK